MCTFFRNGGLNGGSINATTSRALIQKSQKASESYKSLKIQEGPNDLQSIVKQF